MHTDLCQISRENREYLRRILWKFHNIWDVHLSEFNMKSHQINLMPRAQVLSQRPYQTGSKAREFVAEVINSMRKAKELNLWLSSKTNL